MACFFALVVVGGSLHDLPRLGAAAIEKLWPKPKAS